MAERSQESSTENQQGNKQEAKDQPDSTEQQTAETDSLQNGGEAAKENTVKRIEKRQSFGGFFKGLVRYLSFFFSNPGVATILGSFRV